MLYHKYSGFAHIPGEIRVRETPVWPAQNAWRPLCVVLVLRGYAQANDVNVRVHV